jgi:hypothetical protein
MSGLRRHGRHSGHSTCAAGPQNLSAAVRVVRWQENQSGLTLPRAVKPGASATARHTQEIYASLVNWIAEVLLGKTVQLRPRLFPQIRDAADRGRARKPKLLGGTCAARSAFPSGQRREGIGRIRVSRAGKLYPVKVRAPRHGHAQSLVRLPPAFRSAWPRRDVKDGAPRVSWRRVAPSVGFRR